MENEPSPLHVRILVFEDVPGIWTARSLEHDIVAESRSIEMAIQAVLRIMRAHADFDRRHNRAPLSTFRAAPQIYWNAFTRGTPLAWASRLSRSLPGVAAEITVAVAHGRTQAAHAVFQNLHKRLAAQLLERQAAHLHRFRLADRAAVHRAQEIVQQPLPGRRIVEHLADQRRLRRLLHEVAQPVRRGGQPFEEERVDRGIARARTARGGDPILDRSR